MSDDEKFSIAYDGDSFANRPLMAVEDLAPALLALGSLCRATNNVLNGDRVSIKVQVRAEPRQGSFVVDLHLVQSTASAVDHLRLLIEQPAIKRGAEILETIGAYTTPPALLFHSVLYVAKWLRGRAIRSSIPQGDGITLVTVAHDSISVRDEVIEIYRRAETQDALRRLTAPMLEPGIDVLNFLRGTIVQESLTKLDAIAMHSESEEALDEQISSRFWQIRSLSNDPTLLWYFYEGSAKVTAYMRDFGFLEQMKNHVVEVFPGDVVSLVVSSKTLRVSQTKISIRNEIVKVKGVHRNLSFNFIGEDDVQDEDVR